MFSPCRWALWLGAWLLFAGPGPCWTAAHWGLCRPALSLPLHTTPPWPAPRQASPGLEAGEPGKHGHAPCCSGRCRASRKPRGAKEEKDRGGGGDKKEGKEAELPRSRKMAYEYKQSMTARHICFISVSTFVLSCCAFVFTSRNSLIVFTSLCAHPLLCLATGGTCTVKFLWSWASWFLSILRVIISE